MRSVSLQGLRCSLGTLCERVKKMPSGGIAAQTMGHKSSAPAEKRYRRPMDLQRMWHEKIEAWMLEQAGMSFEKPQVPERGQLRAVS